MEKNKIRGEAKSLILDSGIELTYCERGEKNSEIIITGAFFFHTFMPVIEKLAEKFHVYGVIMRFDGESTEKNSDGSTNWSRQWGSDIYNFAKKLNLSKFHYVGKCHGTVPGWYLVKNYPEMLQSFSSFFLAPHTKNQNSNQWFELLMKKDLTAMMSAALRKPETGTPKKMAEMATVGKVDATIIPKYAANFVENIWSSNEECVEFLKKNELPIEYLFGSEDLFFQDHFDSNIFAMMNTKNSRSIILAGERHLMEIDCPERVANEVLNFIEESKKNY
ncbi:MAG: alpha/beta hydrolase [Selenomonadaceae bacterium]|nr:alpha/beta hydrolase [Selenomonadaceae bacterium]